MKDRSDWRLDPAIFCRIHQLWGPIEVDLFASRLTHQCRAYFSWWPDPSALATDAFLQDWSQVKGYANPPWNLIGRVLSQIQSQEARVILIAPVWKTQPWYPVLLGRLTEPPRLLPHPLQVSEAKDLCPQLAAWHISGRDSEAKTFRRELRSWYLNHGGQRRISPMTHSLGDGVTCVIDRVWIPFLDL